ncbi:alpha/beta hydrolase-fold protein [Variovorax sp. J22R133]|uniref:alpha/beta hydrolase n=1 Tax=Variovorax brevis TaxID=3053503 RepID=UPI0025759296|nr:alpha/beta hydrolase-fold protein [Variovorax sp. J22R133]MDM0115913.1 alpha/beta hydrolase-fold protein [Variovorax sp. J22R133]
MGFVRTWRRAVGAGVFALLAAAASLAHASIIEGAEFKSNVLGRSWTYNVYLPTGYDANAKLRYPVLYLLHGNGGDRNDWPVKGRIKKTVDALIEAGDMPPAIIVMPDAGTTWYVDLREKMETAFFEEMIPQVEKNYRTLNTRDGRVIAGLSMGGYGALRYVLEYPEKFQAAALLSPAIYNPEPPPDSSARNVRVFALPGTDGAYSPEVWKAYNYPALWEAFLKKNIKVPMFIDSGDDDEFYIESEATQFYSLLRRNKQPAELRIVNGKHEWMVWESTAADALKYIFQSVRRPQAQ